MPDQQDTGKNPDGEPADAAEAFQRVAERSQKIIADFLARQTARSEQGGADPLNIGATFLEMGRQMMADPDRLIEAQKSLWGEYMDLWQATTKRLMGGDAAEPMVRPEPGDRRFKDAAWEENAVFDYFKQSYLLTARWMRSTVAGTDGLDEQTARKADFYTRQFIDAIAPSNFVLTNPEVLRATVDSGGDNLVKGLSNLVDDLERGKGRLDIRMTDPDAFEVGGNVATTQGKVMFQTDLMQLIQYQPLSETVARRPLLIVPPWINKYYILDLRESNSLVRWASEQGHTVFVISWVNPDAELAGKSFADYMTEGPLAALDAIEQATGEREINAVGYCLGGTLMATTLAYMAAVGDDRIKSATYFATLVDFSEAGDLKVFIDDEQLAALDERMAEKGYLEGHDMAATFNSLRANDLIWSFVVNNYLLGKDPFPFDLLYWNSDTTRMPGAMHSFYLRNMYQENLLAQANGLNLLGTDIDLGRIEIPSYIMASREDHIAPWQATYAATQIYGGPVRFTLSASGHIAGVVNPPSSGKYCYWSYNRQPKKPDTWMTHATRHEGSWWPDWAEWLGKFSGGQVPARKPGDGALKPIEDAPGSYVRVQSED